MTTSIQICLSSFDPSGPPLCRERPALNGYIGLCIHCPHADRGGGRLRCRRYSRRITVREKYALPAWKRLRREIVDRDGGQCVVCGKGDHLHVHHIDGDPSHDDPGNLVSLCEHCHARAHLEIRRGGEERVRRFLHHSQR
ncbi:HNH endonuclease [Methanofollis fontis]|uniref:HNH endonuclease n=1 Tax=Methanofollis fontis TaxID=2052832 RepID=A0A483CU15_9EURY|nr:HNH endonuclease signature motif containing protein [Methanofollis fontis]TAJ44923.1 HNH endonuclease [Methanofollis fontis]